MGRKKGVQSSYSTFSHTYSVERLLSVSPYKAGYSRLLRAKQVVIARNCSELEWCGAESGISNKPGYPPLHLDGRGKIAEGVWTWGRHALWGTEEKVENGGREP
ncbi:hypothetical protein AVEN_81154-1 [Araneus ventricosus]|uniref:Uncharacterized protein n=1 Tax=Araneus ventricosus TaxID=182803 RepID=A0A4Y2T5U4_ARAVE|nr:hypothetical protein AVEN_81154-1 [Araneus ventricosus]